MTTDIATDGTTSHSTRLANNASLVAGCQDSDDLEALFDSIVAANAAENERSEFRASEAQRPNEPKASFEERPNNPPSAASSAIAGNEASSGKVINQIGQMARTLHDTLRELGLHKEIQKAASSIPDARDRLNYVATLTQQAAERVLNATEAAQPVVEKMEAEAHRLSGQWQMLFEKKLDVEQFKNLVTQTHVFLYEVPKQTKATNAFLMEIMMAQDFQDLTGQVIKKIIEVTQDMERQLLSLLIENAPALRQNSGQAASTGSGQAASTDSGQASVKAELNTGMLNGPVINSRGRTDVVTSQDQVDDLLESLGF